LLDKGELDAISVYEPFASRMLASGKFKEIRGPFWREWEKETGKKMEMAGLAASEDWLDKHPDTARKVIAMWCDAAYYIKENPREVLERYSRFTELKSSEELALGAQRISEILATKWDGIDESISRSLEALAADGVLIRSVPPGTIRKMDY
jgi:ABC-type nitrate/sulfonate/bicarbonate transport system substrate-binding protein